MLGASIQQLVYPKCKTGLRDYSLQRKVRGTNTKVGAIPLFLSTACPIPTKGNEGNFSKIRKFGGQQGQCPHWQLFLYSCSDNHQIIGLSITFSNAHQDKNRRWIAQGLDSHLTVLCVMGGANRSHAFVHVCVLFHSTVAMLSHWVVCVSLCHPDEGTLISPKKIIFDLCHCKKCLCILHDTFEC